MMEKKEPKWIRFDEMDSHGRKTKIFHVINKEYNTYLGKIVWYGGFRKYAFFPEPDIVFESTCLQDITNFLVELMEERKKEIMVTNPDHPANWKPEITNRDET